MFDVCLPGHICPNGNGPPAALGNLIHYSVGSFFTGSIVDNHGCAFSSELFGDVSADSLRSSRYDCDFSVQFSIFHCVPFIFWFSKILLFTALHLCETAIDKQFSARDVAAVVGCEKHNSLRDLIWRTEPTERNCVGNHLLTFLARFAGSQQLTQSRRLDGTWAHCVHANASLLQVRCPCPRERTHGSFGGAVNAIRRQSFTADDGRVQDDRGTIRQQRKRLLHREKEAFDVDVEDGVIELLGDRVEG